MSTCTCTWCAVKTDELQASHITSWPLSVVQEQRLYRGVLEAVPLQQSGALILRHGGSVFADICGATGGLRIICYSAAHIPFVIQSWMAMVAVVNWLHQRWLSLP
jgi:hypothetical protein